LRLQYLAQLDIPDNYSSGYRLLSRLEYRGFPGVGACMGAGRPPCSQVRAELSFGKDQEVIAVPDIMGFGVESVWWQGFYGNDFGE
jgi:hypothetical protein